MKKIINRLLLDQKGQGLVEYGMIISLVVLAAVGALMTFGDNLGTFYNGKIIDKIP